ncbi:MAG: hypothetical protein GTO18_20730 [Anaerolineales bacterium]|nr:hypothetical protein [Anaerolineales bacterium]
MKRVPILLIGFLLVSCGLFDGGEETPVGPAPTLPDPSVTTISAPDAEGTVGSFINAWSERDFEQMYAMLSPEAKESISRVDFLQRYEDIWGEMHLTGVDYTVVSSLVNPQDAQVRYRLNLHSAILGDVVRETWMNLVRLEDEWKVEWTNETILPELTNDANLLFAPILPIRANIYDHNGSALVAQADTVALWLVPNQVGDEDAEAAMLSSLSRLLGRTHESILEKYDDIRQYDWYTHLGEVSLEEFQPFEGTLGAVGGVYWRIYPSRYYLDAGLAPHATGYVSWIPQAELSEYLQEGYLQDEFVGQSGIEKVFEDPLRGSAGGTLFLADSEGQPSQVLHNTESESPAAVYTTIDRDLQRHVQNAIEGFTGAVVVLERDTGAVLAMASAPDFDPNLFNPNHPYTNRGLQEISEDTDRPLFNRATSGTYPLGSTFKIITMAAALESGLYEPETVYYCGHEFTELPGWTGYDWTYERELPAQGEISLTQGLVRSCNPWFYHLGYDLYSQGITTALPDMSRGFGLGEATGIEIGDEAGLVPDPDNKLEIFGEEWGPQDSVNLAIGQSFLEATPLQLVRYIAAVGNGGTLYRPQLISKIQSPEGEIIQEFQPDAQGELPISDETLAAIQEALVLVVRGEKGTARQRFLGLDLDIAGKTGTATSGEFTESHAWFAGYTFEEREDLPDIAVVVLVEFSGEGSEWAAPIFRRVIESYFFGQPYRLYPWEERIGIPRSPTPTPGPEELEAEGTSTPES